jgi:hypothetical protein
MRPYNDINIGDIYESPLKWTGSDIIYTVINKDKESKLIEIRSSYQNSCLPETLWTSYRNRIFNRRLYENSPRLC